MDGRYAAEREACGQNSWAWVWVLVYCSERWMMRTGSWSEVRAPPERYTAVGIRFPATCGNPTGGRDLRGNRADWAPKAKGAPDTEIPEIPEIPKFPGALKPEDVPVEFVVKDGVTLLANTRSTVALTIAGVGPARWKLINATANFGTNLRVANQLAGPGMTSAGTSSVVPSSSKHVIFLGRGF